MMQVTIQNGETISVLHEQDPHSNRRLAAGQFTDAINKIPSFTFSIFPQNPCYTQLHERRTRVTVQNLKTGKTLFAGTVLQVTEAMDSSGVITKTVTCEGFLAFLCDSVQDCTDYGTIDTAIFLHAVLAEHNQLVPPEKQIVLGECDVHGSLPKATAYRTTLEEINENLVARLGGEIRIRQVDGKLVLDYLQQYGSRSDSTIQLGKNLQDIAVQTDASSIITRLIPLGATISDDSDRRLTIADVHQGCAYLDDAAAMEQYGVICAAYIWDDVTDPAALLELGKAYLAQNNRKKCSYKLTALDLSTIGLDISSFAVGNEYRVIHPLLGVDEWLRVTAITIDPYRPYKSVLEIGDKLDTMTDLAAKTQHYIQYEAPRQRLEALAAAKETATSLIKAGINGYVVVNENEILIMDTPDKATATKVWRWNAGGFGYSSTGYDGEYGTAITMDGAIVADFITAGILRGIEIANGDNTFHVAADGTVTASAINITGGSMHINTSTQDYSVIALNCGDWKSENSPLQWVLHNTGTGAKILAQAGGIYCYSGNTQTMLLSSGGSIHASGDIVTNGHLSTGGSIHASGDIVTDGHLWYGGVSVQSLLDRIYLRLDSIETRLTNGGL